MRYLALLAVLAFAACESPTQSELVPPVAYTCGEWGEQCDSDIEITSISGTTFDGDRVNMTIVASVPLAQGNVTLGSIWTGEIVGECNLNISYNSNRGTCTISTDMMACRNGVFGALAMVRVSGTNGGQAYKSKTISGSCGPI